MDDKTATEGTWFILGTAHGKYICWTEAQQARVLSAHATRETLLCAEVHDLVTEASLIQDPNHPTLVTLRKDAVATPLDVSVGTASTIDLAGTRLTMFSDLMANDRVFYQELVTRSRGLAVAWAKARSPISRP